ncbi:MAG: class I SAM-dependent methyltransferase [Acidobacteriota bacterium]|nr:class I SAM-dependent methyltransferase [Acidobacteriota bacterium]
MTLRDHFSGVAADYARYRPDYPAALFDWLAEVAPRREVAWDCACGSGQATVPLAEVFASVAATDVSLTQLSNRPPLDNAVFSAAAAEAVPLRDRSVDLVTVGQALHWFDLEAFFTEVHRVLRPGGVVAVWTYGMPEVDDPEIGTVIRGFIDDTLGPWWPPEVVHVLDGYASFELPFADIEPPRLEMEVRWTLRRFLAFVRTWSGVGRYREVRGEDPVEELAAKLRSRWGIPERRRRIRWWLKIRAGGF